MVRANENKQILRTINNVLLLSLLLIRRKKLKAKKQRRRFWIRDIFKIRKQQGAYHQLLSEMKLSDSEKYYDNKAFNKLLQMVGPRLSKLYIVRELISPGERLALTLRFVYL